MNEENKNINYSIEDIRNYLDGKLTGPAMQAMEKAALEDPFLADAIEGFEESRKQSVSFESGIADLQKKLAERIHQKRRKGAIPVWFAYWPVAASILFVIGTTWLTITFVNKKSFPSNIATTTTKDSGTNNKMIQPSIIPKKDTAGSSIIKSDSSTTQTGSDEIASDKKTETERKSTGHNPEMARERNIPAVAAEKQAATTANVVSLPSSDTAEKRISSDSMVFKKTQPPAAPPLAEAFSGKAAGVEISKNKSLSENYIKGIVMDEKGDPVSGASVSLAKSKNGTTTDSNGYFKLYLKSQDSIRKLEFNSVGYQHLSTTVKTDSSFTNRIHLQTSNQSLNDVVVVGYGTAETDNSPGFIDAIDKKRKSDSEPDSVKNKNVQPVNGWVAFSNRVFENKKIETADSLLRGIEVISFIVDEKGGLSSFKIQKSISPAHDATVINLIKGTTWKISNGKKQKCIIAVPYQ